MESLTILLLWSGAFLITCFGADTISLNQTLRDGDTIVSAQEGFELGFFSPGNSKNRYLGIWYKNVSTGTVVWVANRKTPLTNNSISSSGGGVLRFNSEGNLVLVSGTNEVIWSSNYSDYSSVVNPVAQLLDTGNLVIKDATSSRVIWESFDYPGNTLLPGMKIGKDLVTGTERYLTAWKSDNDPSPSNLTVRMDLNGYPQIFLSNGSVPLSRMFKGIIPRSLNYRRDYTEEFVVDEKEISYKYHADSKSNYVVWRMVLPPDGNFKLLNWAYVNQAWDTLWASLDDDCDNYSQCGPNKSCGPGYCSCEHSDGSDKCRGWWTTLECGKRVRFKDIGVEKYPDTRHSLYERIMTWSECETACRNNCSCTAFGSSNGCFLWFSDLIDIKEDQSTSSYLLSVKTADEWSVDEVIKDHKKVKILAATLSPIVGVVLFGLLFAWRKKKQSQLKREVRRELALIKDYSNEDQNEDLDLPLFSLLEITEATNNFSVNNKLGEGGFGPVFKGVLEEGREVAVKRLSRTSRQGLDEFKNEVICIAKLQHRNLVKLLGYCTEGDEMMLIYEYMPNKSLDSFIFHKTENSLLDWPQRFHIIHGIARGLLYLHQDSRLRIIHRDLKAGNILLDLDMNPKISDFGLARSFGGYETGANTNNVVGTYGYISPEYALNGLFSVKSDVYSFGVLVLEIVSGKRNRGFSHQEHRDSLLGHAWRLYKEGKALELVDESLGSSWTVSELLRSIHVGLLCVQQHAEDRPTMLEVVVMLVSEGALPTPKEPGFFTKWSVLQVESTRIAPPAPISVDEATITLLDAR